MNVQAQKVCKDYGNNGNNGNAARITKNKAGRGTPSTPQARPSDVTRRFTHRDFSRPRICAGAICHYPEMRKRGDYTRPQRARTSACSNVQKNTRRTVSV